MKFEDLMSNKLAEVKAVVRFQESLQHELEYPSTAFLSEYAIAPSLHADLAILDDDRNLKAVVEFKRSLRDVRSQTQAIIRQMRQFLLVLGENVRFFSVHHADSSVEIYEYLVEDGKLTETNIAYFPNWVELCGSKFIDKKEERDYLLREYGEEKTALAEIFKATQDELESKIDKAIDSCASDTVAFLNEVASQLRIRFTDLNTPEPWRSNEELFVAAAVFSNYLRQQIEINRKDIPVDIGMVIEVLRKNIDRIIGSQSVQELSGMAALTQSSADTKKSSLEPKLNPVEILVVVAMLKPEFEELMKIVANPVHERPFLTSDHSYCMRGTLEGTSVSIVVATQNDMGMTNAAVLTTKLVLHYQPKYVVMTGIAAGIDASNQQVGDVLIPSHTYDIAMGKLDSDKDDVIFKPKIYQKNVQDHLGASGYIIASQVDDQFKKLWSASLQAAYPDEYALLIKKPLGIHNGPFGSGGTVIAYEKEVDLYKQTNGAIIGFDMEAHAVVTAATECGLVDKPQVFIAKSICDFAGSDKKKHKEAKQALAARSSALYFQLFFVRYIV
jgi:nucleoside phosphorylase